MYFNSRFVEFGQGYNIDGHHYCSGLSNKVGTCCNMYHSIFGQPFLSKFSAPRRGVLHMLSALRASVSLHRPAKNPVILLASFPGLGIRLSCYLVQKLLLQMDALSSLIESN